MLLPFGMDSDTAIIGLSGPQDGMQPWQLQMQVGPVSLRGMKTSMVIPVIPTERCTYYVICGHTSSYINNYQCIYSIYIYIYSIYIYISLISCVIIDLHDLHVCIVCARRVGSTNFSYATNNGGLS